MDWAGARWWFPLASEAALLAAEILATHSGADGCFVAFPTRATSDAMFARVHRWLEVLPGLPPRTSVMLAHGTASLNDEFARLLAKGRGRVACVGEDGDEVSVAHHGCEAARRAAGPVRDLAPSTRFSSPA